MLKEKKNIAGVSLIALLCAIGVISSTNNNAFGASKKKKKTSSISANCLACLDSFSSKTLKFTLKKIGKKTCTQIVAGCDKTNRTNQCENIILDCFDANCTEAGACTDEIANRALFYGCLKAENRFLPYQCASYIKSYAKSKADVAQQALEDAQAEREAKTEQVKAEAQAKVEAEKAKAEQAKAEANAKAEEEETRRKQLEEQNKLALQRQQAELEQKAKDAEIARAKKAAEDERNSRPSVKYQNLLNDLKKDLNTAKNYSTKAYNLLGLTPTSDTQKNGNAFFFPPQIIAMNGISAITDRKTQSLVNGSRYKNSSNFVCTKNTRESLVKSELNNVYTTLKKAYEKIANGISEIEATMADDTATNTIDDAKLDNLYDVQNSTYEVMQDISTRIGYMTTTCETRCEGINNTPSFASSSSSTGLQFDKDGNIIEEKQEDKNANTYNCKDFETITATTSPSNANNFMALMGGGTTTSDMFGGQSKLAMEMTRRLSEDVLMVDKAIDELLINLQSGKSVTVVYDYPKIDDCAQYMVLDIAQYTECAAKVLGQQMLSLSKARSNVNLQTEVNNSVMRIIDTIRSPNYVKKLSKDAEINCYYDANTNKLGSKTISINMPNDTNLPTGSDPRIYDTYNTCVLSIRNALEEAKRVKEKTGNFSFNIDYATNNSITLSNGNVLDPTSFAKNILKWNDVTSCTIQNLDRGNNSTTMIIDGKAVQLGGGNSFNLSSMVLNCTCSDNTTNMKTLQGINSGSIGKSCSDKQGE